MTLIGRGSSQSTNSGEKAPALCYAPQDICYDRIPGQGKSEICSVEDMPQGSPATTLIASSRVEPDFLFGNLDYERW